MKNNRNHSRVSDANNVIDIALGSTPTEAVEAGRTWEMIHCIPSHDWVKTLSFDAQNVEHSRCRPVVDKNLQSVGLLSNEKAKGKIGDLESRRIAEQKGLTWMATKSFHLDTGVAGENVGVGGNIRTGRAVHALNQNTITNLLESKLRKSQNYLQQQKASNQRSSANEQTVTNINVIVNAAGGMGHGSFFDTLHTLADLSAKLKIDIRITPIILMMGTLNPGDRQAAALNQIMMLRSFQTRFYGRYKDLHHTNGDYQTLCNPPILIGNDNMHGEIPSMDRLTAMVGKFLYLINHTPLGAEFRQQAINLHDRITKDHRGALRFGSTVGLSGFHLNKDKIEGFEKNQMASMFLSGLLTESSSDEPAKKAATILAHLNLKESHVDESALRHLLGQQTTQTGGVLEQGLSTFRSRAGKGLVFKACLATYNAGRYVLDTLIPKRLKPALTNAVPAWLQQCLEVINNQLQRYLEQYHGITESRQLLECLREQLLDNEKRNDTQLTIARNDNKSITKAVNHQEQIFRKLKAKTRLFQILSILAKWRFQRQYPPLAERLIYSKLEIAARTILKDQVFPGLRSIIADQINHLNTIITNVTSTLERTTCEADRLENLSDKFYNSVGHELADSPFLQARLQDTLTNEGGLDKTSEKIFEDLCAQFHSLNAFANQKFPKVEDHLVEFCATLAHRNLWQLNVLDVLTEAFAAETKTYDLVSQILFQSDGRIKTSGEADEEIAKVKFVFGPDDRSVNWVVNLANEIDPSGGDWRGLVYEELNGIYFLQYRSQISLSQLVEDLKKTCQPPKDFKELVKLGEDPIVSVAPQPGCDNNEIDRTIAEGLVCGCIVKNGSGWELVHSIDKPLILGGSVAQARETLKQEYPNLVYPHRQFALALAKDEKQTFEKLASYISNGSEQHDPMVAVLGREPFVVAQQVAEALVTYVRRIPLNDENKEF